MNNYELNWSDLAFGSKKPLRELKAIFIQTPREMSVARVTQIIKTYLPTGNIVIGCAKEDYVKGFEGQSQFQTLIYDDIKKIVDKVNNSTSPNKITVLYCSQNDLIDIYESVKFAKVLLVNGSWLHSFHYKPEYYALVSRGVPIEYISPFVSEDEAIAYSKKIVPKTVSSSVLLNDIEMMNLADDVSENSFANEFQAGAILATKKGKNYKLIATAYNKVVPYQTFAWYFGAQREKHLAPAGDLNYYDTIHAEIDLIITAQKNKIDLHGTSLFINLLPCPHCAKMLCMTDISEIVYNLDHSDGYAVALLEKSGKTVRRLINNERLLKNGG